MTDEFGAALTVFSTEDYKVLKTIALGDPKVVRPMGIASPTTAGCSTSPPARSVRCSRSTPESGQIVRTIEVSGKRPWGLALSPDGRKAYTANGPSGDISIVDIASGRVENRIAVGGSPWGIVAAGR